MNDRARLSNAAWLQELISTRQERAHHAPDDTMLRGGRLTKYKGIAASYSPQLGVLELLPEQIVSASGASLAKRGIGLAKKLLGLTAAQPR